MLHQCHFQKYSYLGPKPYCNLLGSTILHSILEVFGYRNPVWTYLKYLTSKHLYDIIHREKTTFDMISVTNTICKPYIICSSLQKISGIENSQYCSYCHSLSDFSSKWQLVTTIFHFRNIRMYNIPSFVSISLQELYVEVMVIVNLFIQSVMR